MQTDHSDPDYQYHHTLQTLFGEWASTFESHLNIIWQELIRLNSLVFIMRKVGSFPFHLFEPLDQDYWVMSFGSMFDTCVLIEYRVWFDGHRDVITLPKLRNRVMKNLRSESYRIQLSKCFKSVPGVDFLANSEGRFKNARHNRIAHLSKEFLMSQSRGVAHDDEPLISDVVAVANTLSQYFQCMCIEHGRRTTLGDYGNDISYPLDNDNRSDIEKLLDTVAKESPLLNMPEQQWELWRLTKTKLPPSDLKIINQYRAKFGMPEA